MPHLRASEVQQLLHNKFVVIMGDSIQRVMYKDLVLLLQKDCLLTSSQLKAKGELSFERDLLLHGGTCDRGHHGSHYREVRQFCSGRHLVRFYFFTRTYSAYVEDVLAQLRGGQYAPDLVVMNSCLWDLSRYGRSFRRRYLVDLGRLFRRLDQVLPESCLLVWNTAMPVAQEVTSSFPWRRAPPHARRLREDVMEANFYSAVEAARHGFDVLDLHFHFRRAVQHLWRDGRHWDPRAHRHLSQLLLAHVADAWGVVLPGPNPAGSRIRDAPAERRPAWTDRRQPQRRGEPNDRAESRGPRQSSTRSRSRPWRQNAFLQSPIYSNSSRHQRECTRETNLRQHHYTRETNSHQQGFTRETNSRQHRYTRETNSPHHGFTRETNSPHHGFTRETNSTGREGRPGPIRRVYTHHRSRGSPYPSRHPSESRRPHQRHTHQWI
ncbi:PC-esterase domain-containing protein 1B-like [Nannospalax galili]|uniref:PC-esterase domain-containing protein 1B-like n=1 Tax=Nannospalax galili TaxID=1026970 RepID=UPI0004ED1E40|nr:PC-esterase domain-containing protein 1B-like [Nannospalax galili]